MTINDSVHLKAPVRFGSFKKNEVFNPLEGS